MQKNGLSGKRGERGQVLLLVLACLLVGGLLIVPSIAFASTVLRSTFAMEREARSLYAAEAGIEDVLWSLKNGLTPRTALPQDLGGLRVTMQTQTRGDYVLYAGEWVPPRSHSDWLQVSGTIVWDGAAAAYKYTVTLTRDPQASGNIDLAEVGARLPPGYTYKVGSAALFGSNLATGEPQDDVDSDGAHILEWTMPTPRPILSESDPTRTQVFYITGVGVLEGYYAWSVATRGDIGSVSELDGTFYTITATATRPENGETAAVVVVDAKRSGSNISIISWRLNQ
ncbi:MAG: hypothetical protein HY670_00675 [Chloroflexi bacterium]|nr:hypothetical protein [Chloroflexota bacterium]